MRFGVVFCAFFSIDSGLWNITQSLEFSYLRSLAFGFCQFLAALGIFSILRHLFLYLLLFRWRLV